MVKSQPRQPYDRALVPARLRSAGIWFAVFLAVTTLSLSFRNTVPEAEYLWLSNALALARVLTLRVGQRPQDILVALALASAAGHMFDGAPAYFATALGLVHMLEVGIAAVLYQHIMPHKTPHDEEGTYLRFTALVALPAAALSALPGGFLMAAASDVSITETAINWLAGNAICLAGVLPLALWALCPPERRYPFTLREMQWTATAITISLIVLGLTISVGEEIQGVLITILLTSLFAMRTGRVGVMVLSAIFVPTLALTGLLSNPDLLGQEDSLRTELYNLAVIFTCIVLPANLIAAMIARLQTAERAQRDIAAMKVEFLSTMSHEIKTPMNAIHGMFELFSRSELTDRQRRWSDAGLAASRNLQAQVTQILEMARLEENTIKVKIRPVNPHKLLENWITAAEAGIVSAGKNLSVAGEVASDVPQPVMIDEGRVQQILINLLTNAVKFSEEGQIFIRLRAARGALVIEVSDTGIGIAPEDQGLVFERFAQVDKGASRKRDGTGLGLAISRELAPLMGGHLTLRSALGQGSTFRLTLPLVTPTEQEGTAS